MKLFNIQAFYGVIILFLCYKNVQNIYIILRDDVFFARFTESLKKMFLLMLYNFIIIKKCKFFMRIILKFI